MGVRGRETVDEPGDPITKATTVAEEALALVQDFITRELATPWPAEGSRPRVAVTSDLIQMWFEDEAGRKILELPSIPW